MVIKNGKHIYKRRRRQDKEEVYIETGSMFITSREELLRTKNRISGEIGFVEIPRSRSFEIDTYDNNFETKEKRNKDLKKILKTYLSEQEW